MLKKHFGISLYTFNKIIEFDYDAVARVKELCELTGAKIVISSDWRKNKNLTQLKNLFQLLGLGQWVIGFTGKSSTGRGDEIQQWLTENIEKVSSFVIIDDNPFDFVERYPMEFVHCDGKVGFNSKKMSQAFDLLKVPLNYQDTELETLWESVQKGSLPRDFKMSYEEVGIIARHENLTIVDVMQSCEAALSTTSVVQSIRLRDFPQEFENILQAALINTNLQRLYISDCAISDSDGFTRKISSHQSLKHLEIEGSLGFGSHNMEPYLKCAMNKIGLFVKIDDYQMFTSTLEPHTSKRITPA